MRAFLSGLAKALAQKAELSPRETPHYPRSQAERDVKLVALECQRLRHVLPDVNLANWH